MHPDIAEVIAATTCLYNGEPNPSDDRDTLMSLVQWVDGSLPSDHDVQLAVHVTAARVRNVLRQHSDEVEEILSA